MKIKVIGVPEFQFSLTGDQLQLLENLAGAHYDASCRQLIKRGGYLYGCRNLFNATRENARAEGKTFNPDTVVHNATFRIVGTLLKILECASSDAARDLTASFHGAITASNQRSDTWSFTCAG